MQPLPPEVQEQIDLRCPCFAKPLTECDCQFDENLESVNIQELAEDLAGIWYEAEDIGESALEKAFGEASEKGESLLCQQVFEASIVYVLEELINGEVGAEVLAKINQTRLKSK